MHHDDRQMSALGPVTDQLAAIPMLPRKRKSVGCFTYPYFCNSQSGKDHWPIGSFVVMANNQRWTGRAVGETDGLHFAQRVNPRTLRRDDRNGTIIYPKQVHKALQRYLDIANSPSSQRFPFNNTEDFAFFG